MWDSSRLPRQQKNVEEINHVFVVLICKLGIMNMGLPGLQGVGQLTYVRGTRTEQMLFRPQLLCKIVTQSLCRLSVGLPGSSLADAQLLSSLPVTSTSRARWACLRFLLQS